MTAVTDLRRTAVDALLDPRAVVVVGASGDPAKLGGVMASMLSGFPRPVLLVNHRGGPGMHTDVAAAAVAAAAAGSVLDLAVLCVPAALCADVVRDCGAAGVGAVLICAGGFSEAGGDGADHERRLVEAAAETGVRILGPNTSGFFVPAIDLRATFVPGAAHLASGRVAVVAASGGVNHALSFALQRDGVGISLGIGIGAGIDIGAVDVLRHLAKDVGTAAVALHLETVSDGPGLLAAVRDLARVKPVVALVVGQNDIGDFAQSHTGALATSWRTTRALLRQAGAVVVDDEQALLIAATALSQARLAPLEHPGVGLVTAQAGPGLLVADHLKGSGVHLPALRSRTVERLRDLLPPMTFQLNPVDTGRPGPQHSAIVSAVAQDPQVDLVAVYALTEPVVDLPAAILAAELGDVVAVLGLDGPADEVGLGRAGATAGRLPVAVGATPLAQAVTALVEDARLRFADRADQIGPVRAVEGRLDVGTGPWDESGVKDLLDRLGVATPRRRLCRTRAEAHAAYDELGGPVVMKVSDAAIVHKSDVGGVHVGVVGHDAVEAASDALDLLGDQPCLVEELAPSGVDLVVGARRDPVFGVTVVVGAGGVATEIYADVAIASYPASALRLAALPDTLASRELLDGHRGGPVADRGALAAVLATLGDLLLQHEHLDEVEINPLRITHEGLIALDAVLVGHPTSERNPAP
jgi:acyl-CoA synthetase (NDP forming)